MPSRSASRPGSGGSLAGSPSMLSLRKSRIAPSSEVTFAPLMQLFSRRLIGPVLYCAEPARYNVSWSARPRAARPRPGCGSRASSPRAPRGATGRPAPPARRAPDHQGELDAQRLCDRRGLCADRRCIRARRLHLAQRAGQALPLRHLIAASHFSSVSRAAVLPDRSGS